MYSIYPISEIKHKKLIFIHTPKCGGSYVSSILQHLNIQNNAHSQAIPDDNVYFTVVRNPVERFESLLNYRLGESRPRRDWPQHLSYVYNTSIELNEIISKMTNDEILNFSPYKTLTHWTTNVDIIITIDNLPKLLNIFGYTYDANLFPNKNVSKKTRGTLHQLTKDRLTNLFAEDVKLYNKVHQSTN